MVQGILSPCVSEKREKERREGRERGRMERREVETYVNSKGMAEFFLV